MCANGVLFHFALKFMLQIICESACESCNRYAQTTVVRLLCFVLFFILFFHFFFSFVLQKAFAPCDLKSKHNNIILDLYHIANYVVWIWNQNSKLHIFIHVRMRMRKDRRNMVYTVSLYKAPDPSSPQRVLALSKATLQSLQIWYGNFRNSNFHFGLKRIKTEKQKKWQYEVLAISNGGAHQMRCMHCIRVFTYILTGEYFPFHSDFYWMRTLLSFYTTTAD